MIDVQDQASARVAARDELFAESQGLEDLERAGLYRERTGLARAIPQTIDDAEASTERGKLSRQRQAGRPRTHDQHVEIGRSIHSRTHKVLARLTYQSPLMYRPGMNTATEHDLDLLLARLKAIADETRLRILSLLAGGERCVCELQDELDAGQSLLSHHLKALKDAGLVTDRRSGRWVHYTLNREALHEIENFVRTTRTAEQPVRLTAPCCE